MYSKWIKSGFILAMLLVSMVSLSMAACPWFIKNELYTAQCGVEKVVPASAGLLANDPGATAVLNWEPIDAKYGTLDVAADGSFVYDPNPDMTSGTYVQFKYNATNGVCAAKYAGTAKIQVSCKCRPQVENITLCLPTTLAEILEELEDAGVDCLGCGVTATTIDLNSITLAPGTWPYFVKCPGCQAARGWVTLVPGCEAEAPDFAFCEGTVALAQLQGMINAQADCIGTGCDQSPLINTANVTVSGGFVTGGSYTATCGAGSECADTDTGIITVFPKCVVNAPSVEICEGKTLAELEDAIEAEVPGCSGVGCDASPVLSYENVIVDADEFVTGGSYTVTCTTSEDCVSSAEGAITVVPKCEVLVINETYGCLTPEELEAAIELTNQFACEGCDDTPEFDFPVFPPDGNGNVVSGTYLFTVTCNADSVDDCDSSAVGEAIVTCDEPFCPCLSTAEDIEVCRVTKEQLSAIILPDNATCEDNGSLTCDSSPVLDLSGVTEAGGFVTGGTYKVFCNADLNCPTATGNVIVNCPCDCNAYAPDICIQTSCQWKSWPYPGHWECHQYTDNEIKAKIMNPDGKSWTNDGAKCTGDCTQMTIELPTGMDFSHLDGTNTREYTYKVKCRDQSGNCVDEDVGTISVERDCNC